MKDPERWLSDPTAPSAMGDMLRAAQSALPTAAEKTALAAQLGLGASVAWSIPLAVKALMATCAALGTGALVWNLSGETNSPDEPPLRAHPSAIVSPRVEAPVAAPAVTSRREPANQPAVDGTAVDGTAVGRPDAHATQVGTSDSRALPPKKASSSRRAAQVRGEAPATAGSEKPSEARLLAAARGALATDPQRALQLLDEHRAAYPRGVLAQEREVMRVDALKRAGQQEAAQEAAETFRKEHPDSVHHLDK